MPTAANVSAGNVHDSERASNILGEARFTNGKFHPRFAMADAGSSSKDLFRLLRRQYRTKPVIEINAGQKCLLAHEADSYRTPQWKALYKQRTGVERAYFHL